MLLIQCIYRDTALDEELESNCMIQIEQEIISKSPCEYHAANTEYIFHSCGWELEGSEDTVRFTWFYFLEVSLNIGFCFHLFIPYNLGHLVSEFFGCLTVS